MSRRRTRGRGLRTAWLDAACICCLSCGSHRLDTATAPAGVAGTVGAGAANIGGAAGSAGSGDTAGEVMNGGASPVGMGDGAAGEQGTLPVEPLVTLDDFAQSYSVGPVNAERFSVAGQSSFSEAWRATMSEPPSSPWIAQLVMPLGKPVKAGQLLHVSFWVSCEAKGLTGDCYTEYIFERASDPWEKSVTFPVHADGSWTQKSEYFSVVDSYEAGASHMVFRLGYEAQVIAIGGLELEAIDAP